MPTILADARPYLLSPETIGPLLEDVWPTLPIGAGCVAEIGRKERSQPWARALLARLREEASAVREMPPQLPMTQTGWRHDFFSRVTAEPLVFDPAASEAFAVPAGGCEGDPRQCRAWALLAHERTARLMRSLALLHALDADQGAAAWVLDGFRRVAAYWADDRFGRDDDGLRGKHHHILYDAAFLTVFADTWGCVRAVASEADRRLVEDGLFAPRVPVLREFLRRKGTHNMSAFVAGALVRMGDACARPEWAEAGLDPRVGLDALLAQGVPADPDGAVDGFWFEGTAFYHFYTAVALAGLAERQFANAGALDPAVRERLTAMLWAGWRLCDGHLRIPALGDFPSPRTSHLGAWRHLYEWAAGRLDPERFRPVLAAITAAGFPRRDLAALAYGPDDPGVPAAHAAGDDRLGAAGIALSRGAGPDAPFVLLRGGAYVGGHDHPDRLSLVLHAGEALLSPDLGEPGYGLRDAQNRSYHRCMPAHNTLFADEREQTGAATIAALPGGGWRGVIRDGQGVRFARSVRLHGRFVLCLDEWQSDAETRFGWIHHAAGDLTLRPQTAMMPDLPSWPQGTGWDELTARVAHGAQGWRAEWSGDRGVRLTQVAVADGAVELTAARGPGNPLPESQGVLVARLPGRQRCLASVFAMHRGDVGEIAVALDPTGMSARLGGETIRLDGC